MQKQKGTNEHIALFRTKQMKSTGAFRILVDGYVTDESGTGVVHSAPAFGEVSSIVII